MTSGMEVGVLLYQVSYAGAQQLPVLYRGGRSCGNWQEIGGFE
jgi:hypothetical protein